MRTEAVYPAAIEPPLQADFPDEKLRVIPDPYNGSLQPDYFFECRNECEGCTTGLGDGYDQVVTRTTYGEIEVFCPACYVQKYLRRSVGYGGRCLDGRSTIAKDLVYVCVLQGGKLYRWSCPHD